MIPASASAGLWLEIHFDHAVKGVVPQGVDIGVGT
jgi:hypothetical protein